MIRLDRISVWLFIISFILLLPGIKFLKMADECIALSFLLLALADCTVNGNWRDYRLLWTIMAVMTFYALYSAVTVHSNNLTAILSDWIIQLKPYIPFAVLISIRPSLTPADRTILKISSCLIALISAVILLSGQETANLLVQHIAYPGCILFISAMTYILVSTDGEGRLSALDKGIAIAMLTAGLGCFRAKYYGIYILCLFFLLVYKPGVMRRFSLKYAVTIVAVCAAFIYVSWGKIEYYFLSGNMGTFDPNVIDSYARPVLYNTGIEIFTDFFPFGSGLASFASFMSSEYYSDIYYHYGINNIFGLSEEMPSFICDAFYPSLAQFGVAGLALFIAFWCYVYRILKISRRRTGHSQHFVVGVLLMLFLAIESVASTTFVQATGFQCMILLGLLCGDSLRLKADNYTLTHSNRLPQWEKKMNWI